MSAPMKKHHTDDLIVKDKRGRQYLLPQDVANKYKIKLNKASNSSAIDARELFLPYEKKYTKPGMLIKGLRLREVEDERHP